MADLKRKQKDPSSFPVSNTGLSYTKKDRGPAASVFKDPVYVI